MLLVAVLGILIAAGAAAIVIAIARGDSPRGAARGRVWSEEHKHWHDAAPARSSGVPFDPRSAAPARPGAGPPPGTPPPGKVWSPDHGHWHDSVNAGGANAPPGVGITYGPAPTP